MRYFLPPPGPPLNILGIETIYFAIIVSLCLIIYFKTREIYKLTKHRGVHYFRNIFLFFSMAYTFRLIHLLIIWSGELFNIIIPRPFMDLSLLLVSYFSTLAILALAMTALIHNIKETKHIDILMHIIAFLFSVIVWTTRSHNVLILIQALVGLVSIIVIYIQSRKRRSPQIISKNSITYLLLYIFWVINTFEFTRSFFLPQVKVLLYLLSIAIFVSIFLRVHKRLADAKKKR
ncbi:hypothetical protein A3K72_01435 [Candidatus Woesearchaeota archaeon RBG_13_36_6]|nr:MAG: hypothetical protein A3K72_01435 [Candidatus Woesearchaeota archaeon RBG_13_36_6]